MTVGETIWGSRRRETARRWRALLMVAAMLGLLDIGMTGLVVADGIWTYRIFHAPEADRCGRAAPIDAETAREIQEKFRAVSDQPTAMPAAEHGLVPWKETGDAAALAPDSLP